MARRGCLKLSYKILEKLLNIKHGTHITRVYQTIDDENCDCFKVILMGGQCLPKHVEGTLLPLVAIEKVIKQPGK